MKTFGKRKKRTLLSNQLLCELLISAPETPQIEIGNYYDTNTDINAINKYVISCFEEKKENIPCLDKKITDIEYRLNNEKFKIIDRKELIKKIDKLNTKKQSIETNEQYNQYIEHTQPILNEWNNIKSSDQNTIKEQTSSHKLSLVRNYIQIASLYSNIKMTLRESNDINNCPYCNQILENISDTLVCYSCGIKQNMLSNDMTYNDINRMNTTTNTYVNKITFLKIIENYQGKETVKFKENMTILIKQYCLINNFDKYTLTPDSLRVVLKKIGYSEYYEHSNLFLSIYINRALPDISQYEDHLMQLYDIFSQKYQEVKGTERDSAMNVWYILLVLIKKLDISYNMDDFKLPEKNTLLTLDIITKRVFDSLGWKFTHNI